MRKSDGAEGERVKKWRANKRGRGVLCTGAKSSGTRRGGGEGDSDSDRGKVTFQAKRAGGQSFFASPK